jgi:hypothetical protein
MAGVGKKMNALWYWQRHNKHSAMLCNCAMMPVSMLGMGSVRIHWRLFKENGEKANTRTAYPYGAMNFISTLGIRFRFAQKFF